jgi:hypothetical protein
MDLASARRVRISDEATVMHTIPHTPDAEQQPRRDDVREQFVNYAEGQCGCSMPVFSTVRMYFRWTSDVSC